MPIQKLNPSGGIMKSKAASVGIGFAAGGPAGAGLALASSNNPGIGKIANAISIGNSAKSLGSSPIPEQNFEEFTQPELGQQFNPDNAMERRFSLSGTTPEDHYQVIQEGLNGLQELKQTNPDLYGQIAEEAAPALLQVKHFHLGGGR